MKIYKQFSNNLVKKQGNIPCCESIPNISDLEVITVSMIAKSKEQLNKQFLVLRNYIKNFFSMFTRIISIINALTTLQFINFINNKSTGEI